MLKTNGESNVMLNTTNDVQQLSNTAQAQQQQHHHQHQHYLRPRHTNASQLKTEEQLMPRRVLTQQMVKMRELNYNIAPKEESESDYNNNNYEINNNYLLSNNNNCAIKRGCDDVDGENEEDLLTLSSSSLTMLKSPAKKPKSVVTFKEMNEFFDLLNEDSIREFLKRDSCCLISDKYALAMVFTYFKRAKFYLNEYTRINFYLALYLASDIEEDIDEYKYEIFPWALGSRWRSKFSGFLKERDALLRRIGYRAVVSRKCCEEVMRYVPDHSAWRRERSEHHGGATRAYLINRSKRFLCTKNNLDEDDLNLPRGPHETPKPCPLCLINEGSFNLNPSKSLSPIMNFNPKLKSSRIVDNMSNKLTYLSSTSNLAMTSGTASITSTATSSVSKSSQQFVVQQNIDNSAYLNSTNASTTTASTNTNADLNKNHAVSKQSNVTKYKTIKKANSSSTVISTSTAHSTSSRQISNETSAPDFIPLISTCNPGTNAAPSSNKKQSRDPRLASKQSASIDTSTNSTACTENKNEDTKDDETKANTMAASLSGASRPSLTNLTNVNTNSKVASKQNNESSDGSTKDCIQLQNHHQSLKEKKSKNNKSNQRINDLILSENTFIFKNTNQNYKLLSPSKKLTNAKHLNRATITNKQFETINITNIKFPSVASVNCLMLKDQLTTSDEELPTDDDDEDDEENEDDDDDDDNDEVFTTNISTAEKRLHKKFYAHDYRHSNMNNNSNNLNNRKLIHQAKWTQMNPVNNQINFSTKRRLNCSLSANSALSFTFSKYMRQHKLNEKPAKSKIAAVADNPCALVYDQLVPRESHVEK
jgi:hypothetical protein